MTDDLEFSISQYLDGTLAEDERVALERRLAEEPEARASLDEYRRLDLALKAAPLPDVKWELLAGSISDAIAESESQRYRMPTWARRAASLSLAASVFIAAAIGTKLYLAHRTGAPHGDARIAIGPTSPKSPGVLLVTGPEAEAATGKVVAEVAIGPAPAATGESAVAEYSDEIISRPSRVTVASGLNPAQDTPAAIPVDLQ